jgi:hypothetical protein
VYSMTWSRSNHLDNGARLHLRGAGAALLVLSVGAGCGGPSDSMRPPGSMGSGAVAGVGAGAMAGAGAAAGAGGAAPAGGTGGAPAGTGGGAGSPQAGGPNLESVIPYKAIHRLSNTEYDNTVRDLLGTDPRFGEGFVAEEAHGFDNIATALSMSPRHVEDYFAAARALSASVFADPTLRARIVACDPVSDAACPRATIEAFGRRAFRRPLETSELDDLLQRYQQALDLGVDAFAALQHVVHIVLASPQFLYRIEFDPNPSDATPHALSGFELASRLSYALWSSMPDEPLFTLAASGGLAEPATLAAEVDRMVSDPRSVMLAENFAAQWFGSKRLASHASSTTAFPSWSPELALSMQREMELYFDEFLHGDLSYADFLTADVNFVDQALATHYGVAPPAEPGFQRVMIPGDGRQGLLGLAGFLTHTSRETRTSPIIRGKWILDAIWCVQLELPTDIVVEPLPEPAEGEAPTTVRDLMAAHRSSPACAGCHSSIDPIGLALEKFDAVGRYREVYENELAIDTVTIMPEGQTVDGLESLSLVLAQDPQFLPCAASKFGTYAMGLTLENANRDQIVARWSTGTPTLKALLRETLSHEMFRMRRAETP